MLKHADMRDKNTSETVAGGHHRSRPKLGASSLGSGINEQQANTVPAHPGASTARSSHADSSVRSLPVVSPIKVHSRSPTRSAVSSGTRVPTISLVSSLGEAICRICHIDGTYEQLLSPCYCSGTMGLLHLTCLQRWLGTSNRTVCELCNFQFKLQRRPRPLHQYIRDPGTVKDKRHLTFDIVCVSVLTPLILGTCYLCIHGSTHFQPWKIEFIGLVALTLSLFTLYTTWLVICFRQNVSKWRKWQQFNQEVKLICEAPGSDSSLDRNRKQAVMTSSPLPNSPSRPSPGQDRGMKLRSIQIKMSSHNDMDKPKGESVTQTQSVAKRMVSDRRRHDGIPYMTSFNSQNTSQKRNSADLYNYVSEDDLTSPSERATSSRYSEQNDSEVGRYQVDKQRNMQVSSWVMNSSGFKDNFARPRVQMSPTSDSYHTASQSLSSSVSHGAQGRRIPIQSTVSHGIQGRRYTDQSSASHGSQARQVEQRRHETCHVGSAQSGGREYQGDAIDKRRYSFPVCTNLTKKDRELDKKDRRPNDRASLQSLGYQTPAAKCGHEQSERNLPDIPETAVRDGSVPENSSVTSPIKFTDAPAGQSHDGCVWTRPTSKETYI